MRFYTKQHQFYCGIDLHARTMYLCVLNQDGAILLHRNMPAGPDPFLKAVAPYRADLVVCVECIFPWYWLADLCAREGIPFVLGHALSMKAMHGGKAKNDNIDAQKIAGLLRGGMLPQAYVYPAEMRATRDLLRRWIHLMRKRAELLTHVQQTNSQDTLPEIGKKIAYKANRPGVAERFTDPAVHKSVEVALALLDYDDQLLGDLELAMVKTAKQHDANTLYVLQTVPGIGRSCVSSCCLRCMTSPASPGSRISCPLAAWSNAPRNRPGSGMAPPARRSGTRSHVGLFRSGGPVPPQQSCGPKVSGPLREKTRDRQGLNGLGA